MSILAITWLCRIISRWPRDFFFFSPARSSKGCQMALNYLTVTWSDLIMSPSMLAPWPLSPPTISLGSVDSVLVPVMGDLTAYRCMKSSHEFITWQLSDWYIWSQAWIASWRLVCWPFAVNSKRRLHISQCV